MCVQFIRKATQLPTSLAVDNAGDGEQPPVPLIRVMALDLEGTLVTDATSRVPRSGLTRFLRAVRRRFPRIVIFTSVSEERFRKLAKQLVKQAKAPPWLVYVKHLKPQGTKNLSIIPEANWQNVLLVDDYAAYVHPRRNRSGSRSASLPTPIRLMIVNWRTSCEPLKYG